MENILYSCGLYDVVRNCIIAITRGWALDRAHKHNSRQPCGAVSMNSIKLPHGCFDAIFGPCDLDLWPFDLTLNGGWGIVMDYPCAKFGDFSFSHLDFIVRTDWITEADQRYTQATTVVDMSNDTFSAAIHTALNLATHDCTVLTITGDDLSGSDHLSHQDCILPVVDFHIFYWLSEWMKVFISVWSKTDRKPV